MTCCVTGHRPKGFPFPHTGDNEVFMDYLNLLYRTVGELIVAGYDSFITGMAEGADIDFAICVLEWRKQYPHITLEGALPYPVSPYAADSEYTRVKRRILGLCDKVTVVSPAYTTGCMQKRNIYMVDRADLVLAIWNGQESGGTFNTLRYANMTGKTLQVLRLSPGGVASDGAN